MDLSALFVYLIVGGITPGPNNLMTLYLTTHYGIFNSRKFFVGSMLTVFIKLLLCGSLNMLFVTAIPRVIPYLKWVGAAYMLYLAVHMVWDGIKNNAASNAVNSPEEPGNQSTYEVSYMSGIVLQILNMKSWVYALSIFSIFIISESTTFKDVFIWSVIALIVLFSCTMIWGIFGTIIKGIYSRYRLAINLLMGIALIFSAIQALL